MDNRRIASTDAIGYVRVSTAEQVDSGLGIAAQRRAIEQAAGARGLNICRWAEDAGISGSVAPAQRPALASALAELARGEACALVVAKLDRLSRTTLDLLTMLTTSDRERWALVSADSAIDTSTTAGRFSATVMGAVAQLERDLIRDRTRDALVEAKARGQRLGRPVQLPAETRERIRVLKASGLSYAAVVATLDAEGVRQMSGRPFDRPSVARVVRSLRLDDHAETGMKQADCHAL